MSSDPYWEQVELLQLMHQPLRRANVYMRAIARMEERDVGHLYQKYWSDAAFSYTTYGMVPTPEAYIEAYLAEKTVRIEAGRDQAWMGREYPEEYMQGHLRGTGTRLQVDMLNSQLKTSADGVTGMWGFIEGVRFIPGNSFTWVRNELDCYRQHKQPDPRRPWY